MIPRRRAALALLLLLPGAPALAQQRAAGRKPAPLDLPKQPALPPPSKSATFGDSTAAPVPDRSREGPRVVEQDRARLNPGIINRNLPGRGQVDQGAPDMLEDKLFRPAPGVRLNAPFTY